MTSDMKPTESREPDVQHAVIVRNASKSYGTKRKPIPVFNNLNMTVQQGSSGSGKTTLLTCIVGLRWLDSGKIYVLGSEVSKGLAIPGKQIGYMPQQLCLFGAFTIKETSLYFGWIFGIETEHILQRLNFLLSLLDLPKGSYLVKNLSGGQKRRVSFIIALLNDSKLLILDEPTVGVDPLLRKHIWDFLNHIVQDDGKTVIITTHYIEETRNAHRIGLMRNGVLLVEESPNVLLEISQQKRLQDVYLQLSIKQEESMRTVPQFSPNDYRTKVKENEQTPKGTEDNEIKFENKNKPRKKWIKSGHLHALLYKNFLRMFRNHGLLVFIFLLPAFQIMLFFLGIGKEPHDVKLAVYSEEAFINNSMYCENMDEECNILTGFLKKDLSCRVMDAFKTRKIFKFKYYKNLESARESVESQETWGVIYFGEHFTLFLFQRWAMKVSATNESLEKSKVNVWLDMSNQQIGYSLINELYNGFITFGENFLTSCKLPKHLMPAPLKLNEPIYGKIDPKFTDFIAPGIVASLVFFMSVVLTTSSLITERIDGILERSLQAGVNTFEIILSHVIAQCVVLTAQMVLILFLMFQVYQLHNDGSFILFAILTFLCGLCGMSLGFVISAICDLERTVVNLSLGIFYPSVLLGGVIWPIEAMPRWLYWCARFLPISILTTSLREILVRGWGLNKLNVLLGLTGTLGWCLVFLIGSIVVFKFKITG